MRLYLQLAESIELIASLYRGNPVLLELFHPRGLLFAIKLLHGREILLSLPLLLVLKTL